ncbi:Subtilase family protein [Chitinophaga eiseniae]|uniref:Subtilase family protein n=1 Tax=Chitinophaga eiseniae TaxID=634771 RepID=A0A1T4TBN4_9BACT|nr:S8 family serine peptidase [Chitinophaga eiseniae]SKA37915.1 Subtilase family protein [Chitinophaga eiseniae]
MKIVNVFAACMLFATFVSCKRTESVLQGGQQPSATEGVVPKSVINGLVFENLHKTGRFDWKMVSDSVVWSALVQGDSILSVGFQPSGTADISREIDKINVNAGDWQDARQKVLSLITEAEQFKGDTKLEKGLVTYQSPKLPVFYVKASRFATVKALRASALVRYAEPVGYARYMQVQPASGGATSSSLLTFGCDSNLANTSLVPGVDYTNITPGAKQSWNYANHNIPQAWTQSTGANVKIMLIDTGVSPTQDNLGSNFNQGASTGRTIEKINTFPGGTPADVCGHGTKMAGVIGAPRGTGGNSAGIAYNSNLITVHAAENVVILSPESVQGIGDAYVLGGDNAAVKIISMSMGSLFSFGHVTDGIRYAYNKGKLMFCAAGTTNSTFGPFLGVVYPATMPEVQAVTGVKDNGTSPCEDCHSGREVAFDIIMEKSTTGRNPLTTAATGNPPSTVGGSSVATASCAAIAALVWSKYPTYSRDSILARMRRASSFYNNKHGQLGWGVVDAQKAVGN